MEPRLRQVVEALLFAAPKPITARQIAQVLPKGNASSVNPLPDFSEVSESVVLTLIEEIRMELETNGSGFVIQEIAGGFRYATRPEVAPWVRQLHGEAKPSRMSQPALETLAIIAYRQPISRADIEAVRGVAVDGVVATLLERRMIQLAGRSEAPGKPLLYETTSEFLETFGLRDLQELPNADELRRIPLPRPASAAQDAPGEQDAPVAVAPVVEEDLLSRVEHSTTEEAVASAVNEEAIHSEQGSEHEEPRS